MSVSSYLSVHDLQLYNLINNGGGNSGGNDILKSIDMRLTQLLDLFSNERLIFDLNPRVVVYKRDDHAPYTTTVVSYTSPDGNGFVVDVIGAYIFEDQTKKHYSYGEGIRASNSIHHFYRDFTSIPEVTVDKPLSVIVTNQVLNVNLNNQLLDVNVTNNPLDVNVTNQVEQGVTFATTGVFYDIKVDDTWFKNQKFEINFYRYGSDSTLTSKTFSFKRPGFLQISYIVADNLPLNIPAQYSYATEMQPWDQKWSYPVILVTPTA